MQLGYSVDLIKNVPWIATANCFYWGDIDTHGLAILNRIRHYYPHIESFLMDEKTLRAHAALWVTEQKQHPASSLENLSLNEQQLYQALIENKLSTKVRLE